MKNHNKYYSPLFGKTPKQSGVAGLYSTCFPQV